MHRTYLLCCCAVLAALGLIFAAPLMSAEQDGNDAPAPGAQDAPADEPVITGAPFPDEELTVPSLPRAPLTPLPTTPPPPQPQAKSCAGLPPKQTSSCTQCNIYCSQVPLCAPYCVPEESQTGPYYCECVYYDP